MNKQVLDASQMRRLSELGLETRDALFAWVKDTSIPNAEYELLPRNMKSGTIYSIIPAYTLADILEMLPKQLEDSDGLQYRLQIFHDGEMSVVSYYSEVGKMFYINKTGEELIDVAYATLCECIEVGGIVGIEIKQPEEDMEEKKQDISKMETTTKKMRPFDLEAAKSGKPVRTRDGRKARIVCFDRKVLLYSVIALIEEPDGEEDIVLYSKDGHYEPDGTLCELDLMMFPEKKEGWAMICKSELYESEEIALEDAKRFEDYIKTVKVEWYE